MLQGYATRGPGYATRFTGIHIWKDDLPLCSHPSALVPAPLILAYARQDQK